MAPFSSLVLPKPVFGRVALQASFPRLDFCAPPSHLSSSASLYSIFRPHHPSQSRFWTASSKLTVQSASSGTSSARHPFFRASARGGEGVLSSLRSIFMASSGGGEAPRSENSIIVITGVTRGLGRALAVELAKRGHAIAGCGRDQDHLDTLKQEIPGEGHFLAPLDVASDSAVKAFAEETVSKLGVPRIVVNCAGVINKNNRLWEVSAEEFASVMSINVNGTANVIRHFAPHLIHSRRGVIVNFSSGWGRSASADVAPYCASKWAVEGMTRALAKELPEGVAVVALNPGVVDTDMLRSCFGSSASLYGSAGDWAPLCADLILRLGAKDNGSALTV